IGLFRRKPMPRRTPRPGRGTGPPPRRNTPPPTRAGTPQPGPRVRPESISMSVAPSVPSRVARRDPSGAVRDVVVPELTITPIEPRNRPVAVIPPGTPPGSGRHLNPARTALVVGLLPPAACAAARQLVL